MLPSRLAVLPIVAVALAGCGVDSTRSMWAAPWTEPGRNHAAYEARHTGEVAAKVALTPGTIVVDALTDPLTWQCALVVAEVTLECCSDCCGGR
jgi:hypothetical protein